MTNRKGNTMMPTFKSLLLAGTIARVAEANRGETITVFEILTAVTFLLFSEHPADAAIVEVGLGGRFDATNVIACPAVSLIMPVSLDPPAMAIGINGLHCLLAASLCQRCRRLTTLRQRRERAKLTASRPAALTAAQLGLRFSPWLRRNARLWILMRC